MKPIFDHLDHRPWPLPNRPWLMAQTWHNLLFAHWPLPPELIAPLIPPPLTVDTFDGQAWIGVVPFRMTGVRPRWITSVPWLSAFPELNVRTYVNYQEKPGVWFFSLEAPNPIAVWLARRFFHLPYMNAHMTCHNSGETIEYHSERTHHGENPAVFIGKYRPIGAEYRSQPGSLDHWLTERYCLYTCDSRKHLYRGEIHHRPWPLHRAEAEITRNTMALSHNIILPEMPPLLHYIYRLDVAVWLLTRL